MAEAGGARRQFGIELFSPRYRDQPHIAVVEELKARAVALKDRLATLRKSDASVSDLDGCRAEIAAVEKAARDAQARADTIDAAVYDLKAVNPRAVADADTRTTEEIIESIEAHGLTIEKAVASLKELIAVKV